MSGGWVEIGSLAHLPFEVTRGEGRERLLSLSADSGRFRAKVPLTLTFDARRIARLFGVSLLDLDPALARDVRRAHVEYDRRRRARRRRRRA